MPGRQGRDKCLNHRLQPTRKQLFFPLPGKGRQGEKRDFGRAADDALAKTLPFLGVLMETKLSAQR